MNQVHEKKKKMISIHIIFHEISGRLTNLVQDPEDNVEINFIHVISYHHIWNGDSLYYVTSIQLFDNNGQKQTLFCEVQTQRGREKNNLGEKKK